MSPSPALHGEIEGARPLRAPGGKISLQGWCLVSGQEQAPPVRLVTSAGILDSFSRVPRPDVAALLPGEPAAAGSGFLLNGAFPAGLHEARFEARLPGGDWRVFKRLSLAVEAASFAAGLDEPISEGTLRDRVKVGGWALDPTQPVEAVSLRYGHREIACTPGEARADVAAIFPDLPRAAQAGFISDDFLVAGHGPVRIRARLADGSVRVVSTPVTFSIATDENHGPGLSLTGERHPLAAGDRVHGEEAPVSAGDPLNLLFVLPGSFAANSALHVAALANELAAAGHACVVAVSHDVATLAHHDAPRFRGVLHADVVHGVTFPNGRGPDLVHAWTTRENVRLVTQQLQARHGAKTIVHLEDNEQQILALALQRPWAELEKLPAAELNALVPPDLSHPRNSRAFLAQADGVTVITERLQEFVPAGHPVQVIFPAADSRHFFPRPQAGAFRTLLAPQPDTTILFYHGNVHAANAAEVRDLYAAVLALNRGGDPTVLIRTGLDTVDFLGDLAAGVAPHVLALGQILHHRHLAPLMALADIFVQPGRPDDFNNYRFPSKLPEFFALGRPVILPRTNLGALVRHGIDAYVVDAADADGIAGAVRALRADRALAARLAQGAADFAAAHFSWRRSAEALAKFYQTLARS